MRFWIELSGEHPTLPRAEALAALEAERVEVRKVSWSAHLLRLDAVGPVDRAVRRLGLAHVVSEELAQGDLEDLRAYARSADLGGKSFRTRAHGLEKRLDHGAIEGSLGADFGRTGRVDLTNPNVEFRVLVADEFLLGRVMHRVDRSGLEARKVTHRSFNLPISLHPKLARALVNLSRVPTGGLLLDPFCGTGGVLLEASHVGLRAVGSDLRRSMVVGARKSLRPFGAEAGFLAADAGQGPWRPGRIDGIATDPPYGRAASTRGEPTLRLYERAFAAFADALPSGGHAAVVLPNEDAIQLAQHDLELVERHSVRVHRSLTRHFCVFRKSPSD
ncbi:MAG: TRM11 family methyltransferase [Thermoplasmata archaeon]